MDKNIWEKDVTILKIIKGQLCELPHNTPSVDILVADTATLCISIQKTDLYNKISSPCNWKRLKLTP